MTDPFAWPGWLQAVLIAILLLGAALAWATTDWGALLVIGSGVLFAVRFQFKNSRP